MTAQEFWRRFQKEIHRDPSLCQLWNDPTAFTVGILDKLEEVIAEDGVQTEREYFRIDLISYKSHLQARAESSREEEKLYGQLKRYAWDLMTAVEHENDHRLWMDEVVKLAHIASPLRVVIGYLPHCARDEHEIYLSDLAEALGGIRAWQQTRDAGEFLIVIGHCKLARDEEDQRCVYTPYIWENGCFTRPAWL